MGRSIHFKPIPCSVDIVFYRRERRPGRLETPSVIGWEQVKAEKTMRCEKAVDALDASVVHTSTLRSMNDARNRTHFFIARPSMQACVQRHDEGRWKQQRTVLLQESASHQCLGSELEGGRAL